jgi:hypothetical protein
VISLSVFSQYVIIHPYLFDLFILVPVIIVSFIVAPVMWVHIVGEKIMGNRKVVLFFVILSSILYVWFSLREFAILSA